MKSQGFAMGGIGAGKRRGIDLPPNPIATASPTTESGDVTRGPRIINAASYGEKPRSMTSWIDAERVVEKDGG